MHQESPVGVLRWFGRLAAIVIMATAAFGAASALSAAPECGESPGNWERCVLDETTINQYVGQSPTPADREPDPLRDHVVETGSQRVGDIVACQGDHGACSLMRAAEDISVTAGVISDRESGPEFASTEVEDRVHEVLGGNEPQMPDGLPDGRVGTGDTHYDSKPDDAQTDNSCIAPSSSTPGQVLWPDC